VGNVKFSSILPYCYLSPDGWRCLEEEVGPQIDGVYMAGQKKEEFQMERREITIPGVLWPNSGDFQG
jgi:hypothetical protein